MKRSRVLLRKALRWCGLALSVLALVWIGRRFVRGGGIETLSHMAISRGFAAALMAGVAVYVLALCLLAFAWWRMLARFSPLRLPGLPTMATYAVSQYGKYLPGNVAHYALRHAWGRRHGIPHESLALAALLEALLLLVVAFALSLAVNLHRVSILSRVDPSLVLLSLVAGIVALTLILRWARGSHHATRWHIPALAPATLAISAVCYAGFFLLGTLSLAGLALGLGDAVPSFVDLLAANAASWFAGFVVVGAPAGLGVREATFVALAGGTLGESQALLLIGLFRLVTFVGDTLFFAAGSACVRIDARRSGQRAG